MRINFVIAVALLSVSLILSFAIPSSEMKKATLVQLRENSKGIFEGEVKVNLVDSSPHNELRRLWSIVRDTNRNQYLVRNDEAIQNSDVLVIQKLDSKSDIVAKRMIISNGMTSLNPIFQKALGELSVWDEALISHYSFLNPNMSHDELIVWYRNSEFMAYRLALAVLSPNAVEAIHIWEREAIGRVLDLEEIQEFIQTNEYGSLYEYSVSLDISNS